MTDDEWRQCGEPARMLTALGSRASPRKLRLFACACCHRIAPLLTDPRSQEAMHAAERFADGRASRKELNAAKKASGAARGKRGRSQDENLAAVCAWSCTGGAAEAANVPWWALVVVPDDRLERQRRRRRDPHPRRGRGAAGAGGDPG